MVAASWQQTTLMVSSAFCVGYALGNYFSLKKLKKKIFALYPSSTSSGSVTQGGEHLVLAIVLLADLRQDLSFLADVASRTVLGQFKKLYKRRDPRLAEWEATGHVIESYCVAKETDLQEFQMRAREMHMPTHTFVTFDSETRNKMRKAMVIGPGDACSVSSIVSSLQKL
jgi:hypothetical protein